MKMPESVKVGPFIYAVSVEDDLRDPKDNRELYGRWETSPACRIRIRGGEGRERTIASLLHEGLHAIDEAFAIGLGEKQITRLGVGLAAFLLDNGLLKEDDGAEGV